MSDSTQTAVKAGKTKPDPRLVKHVARVIAGIERPQWVALGKDGQKPHVTTAKRVLLAINRYLDKPNKGGKAAAADDDDI